MPFQPSITQGKTKCGTAVDFPYPIKLELENIDGSWPLASNAKVKLTVMRLPDQPVLGYGIPNPYQTLSALNSAGKLFLSLEVSTTREFHGNGKKNCKYREKHPCRGGKFRVRNSGNYQVANFTVGQTYTFQIGSDGLFIDKNLDNLINKAQAPVSVFFYVRGTLRMEDSNNNDLSKGLRTGIYSNIAKITLSKEE